MLAPGASVVAAADRSRPAGEGTASPANVRSAGVMPALYMTRCAAIGQFDPDTCTLSISWLLCGGPAATCVAPELYQLPSNMLSSVLFVELALVKAQTPVSCTTLLRVP